MIGFFTTLKFPKLKLKINHRKIIEAITKKMKIEKKGSQFITILDKLDKIGWAEAEKDFHQMGLTEDSLAFLSKMKGAKDVKALVIYLGIANKGIMDVQYIENFFNKNPLQTLEIVFDSTLARGLGYYTGTIFEVLPPQEFIDLKGQIGSIGGGGRYDGLLDRFGMKDISGVGMSFGFERLYMVVEALGLFPDNIEKNTQVMFVNFGQQITQNIMKYIQEVRDLGIRCELYPTDAKIKKQMQYISQRNIPYALLIGPEELKEDSFILKNMQKKEQNTYPLKDVIKIIKKKILF